MVFEVFFFNFNIRLSVVYSELWFDSQRVSADKDIERTLSEAVAYVTDPLYQISSFFAICFLGISSLKIFPMVQ